MITQQELRDRVHYDPDTGIFRTLLKIKGKTEGEEIGYSGGNGALQFCIKGRRYYLHTLAFIYMEGGVPKAIDHINMDRTDNRWSNLREANKSLNACNVGLRSDNTSGIKGLRFKEKDKLWHCAIQFNGKQYHKYFKEHEQEEAIEWLNNKRAELHKEFARF